MIEVELSPGSEGRAYYDEFVELFEKYYEDDLAKAAQKYPNEQDWVEISYKDAELVSTDLAEGLVEHPDTVQEIGRYALSTWEFPVNDLSFDEDIELRVSDLPERYIFHPEDLRAEHGGMYVGIKGSLGKITQPLDYANQLAFSCTNKGCESTIFIEQDWGEMNTPNHVCPGCEQKNGWEADIDESDWTDLSQVQIQQSIDQSKGNEGCTLTALVTGSLVEGYGTELYARAGEDCVAYGILKRENLSGSNSELLFNQYLDVKHIDFDTDEDTVNPDNYREQIHEYANRENPVELFVENIAPQLKITDRWERAVWLATAYLFKAPRIHTDSGEIYRGDIHAGIIGDPGIGKSVLNRAIEQISPKCERRSATGISSDVGLTAAAIKDDFGEGEYTLEPGILVRANGGHAILDEIDKGPGDLQKINDALEGDQRVTVDKGGKHAEFATRTALWATGNPEAGRFDRSQGSDPLPMQVDIDKSLEDRFDGLILIPDEQDTDHDNDVAGHILDAYEEASNSNVENEILDREVTLDELQAWVMIGQEIDPSLTESAKGIIQEYYTKLRDRNDDENTFVTTARGVESLIRFSGAFARLHLSDEITDTHADLATELMDKIIGQYYDPETGEWVSATDWDNRTPKTQDDRIDSIKKYLRGNGQRTPAEVAHGTSLDEDTARKELEKMSEAGEILRPKTGVYEAL